MSQSNSENDIKLTPMMAQWSACKERAQNALLLFRMGDFYEAFYSDAATLAKELELVLTQRQGIPMSGVPHHACEAYIDKLVSKGYRVAIAEQTEDPKQAKGLVKRQVVRVVTPGTLINSNLLSEKTNNFFASIDIVNSIFGLSYLDLTTAEFYALEFEQERDLLNEVSRLRPSEFLVSDKFDAKYKYLLDEIRLSYDVTLNILPHWHFDYQITHEFLIKHLHVHNLDGFGLQGAIAAINTAGALLQYLKESLCLSIDHIQRLQNYSTSQYLSLDRTSLRNLELTESLKDGSRKNTLLAVVDRTLTPMGARLIHHWIKQPLLSTEQIQYRQNAVKAFVLDAQISQQLKLSLDQIRDLERLIIKIGTQYALPRDLISLANSLQQLPIIRKLLMQTESSTLQEQAQQLSDFSSLIEFIRSAILEEPAVKVGEGNVFKVGFHAELDELLLLKRDGKLWISQYQAQLREEIGIKTLKIGFNRVFGYYIEVSSGQADRMPSSFMRRQTLANSERFLSSELKEYEEKVLNAEEKIATLEQQLFQNLRLSIIKYAQQILSSAKALAQIDCLYSYGQIARERNYCCPVVDTSKVLRIEKGRHPVIEATLQSSTFTPNDTLLDDIDNRLFIITGPNMAGKSTYIRQVALIVIMAQIGSFVPAVSAHIGLVDRIFTRIGASDDLSRGQSTFMVEMTEAANILNNATSHSLIILDEIGRGTSTYDGISIAWSVAEYLLTASHQIARTLFATHYWELTHLEEMVAGAVNYHVSVKETAEGILFLHQIVRGCTDKSYGIHVAQLAGLPASVINRAKEILFHLEENSNRESSAFSITKKKVKKIIPSTKEEEEQHPQHRQMQLF